MHLGIDAIDVGAQIGEGRRLRHGRRSWRFFMARAASL
jgi:hypothetical protein